MAATDALGKNDSLTSASFSAGERLRRTEDGEEIDGISDKIGVRLFLGGHLFWRDHRGMARRC